MLRICSTILVLLTGFGHSQNSCTTRRCLTDIMMKKNAVSQPQGENCTLDIFAPFIEYQTLSVDTKNLVLVSQMKMDLTWFDPELSWDKSVYDFDQIILPVDQVWTPEIRVTNGISTSMKHNSKDLLVYWDGEVYHSVIIKAEVNCEVNLFNYPFATDKCPVAFRTWNRHGCGSKLNLYHVWNIDNSHGDWKTTYADLEYQYDRPYIQVGLSIRYLNPFITLMLPSILLVMADMVSFYLPLGGGERNCFKVTLVLSFTMFLVILNDMLPGDSKCSPIIRTHFCVCLVLLVFSMLVSMVLTGMAQEGSIIFSLLTKKCRAKEKTEDKEEITPEVTTEVSFIELKTPAEESPALTKVVEFLEDLTAKSKKAERYRKIAKTVDRIFFWLYLVFGVGYFIGMCCVMVIYKCEINHFGFWATGSFFT